MIEPKTVLIADDNLDLLNTLVQAIKNENIKVYSANNGLDAVKVANDMHPQLLLIDEMMPGMTGLQVIEEIRASDWGKDIPIIMLTNVDNTSEVNNAIKYGVSDYLVKSDIHLDQIKTIVNQKLNITI